MRLLISLLLCLLSPQVYAQKTQAQLTTEIGTTFPDNTSGLITPAGVRSYEQDVVNTLTVAGTSCPTANLSKYQRWTNTTNSPTGTTLNIFDNTNCVPFASLNETTHAIDFTVHSGAAPVAPTASACTGFALAAGASDMAGKLTYTSATTCSVAFGTAFANPPACVVAPGTAASTTLVTTTTAVMSVTFGTAQTAFSWICRGA